MGVDIMMSVQPRKYVVMELKGNLVKDDRVARLKQYGDNFKKVAYTIIGEPTQDFKKLTQEKLLEEKQRKSDMQFKATQLDEKRKRELAKKQKEADRARKKLDF